MKSKSKSTGLKDKKGRIINIGDTVVYYGFLYDSRGTVFARKYPPLSDLGDEDRLGIDGAIYQRNLITVADQDGDFWGVESHLLEILS